MTNRSDTSCGKVGDIASRLAEGYPGLNPKDKEALSRVPSSIAKSVADKLAAGGDKKTSK